ncbi:acetyltransferase, gnat family protein [Mycobacterium xenopi 4042]|uniref:Acetyltransferase, gnat family protein n=1 Tax=Mycobacterium xenopi 4042 TaxID=1299334 RepID=X7ZWI1_MYCXE|nr:acetyltransferase, gnat family protein [Mycobacterium xenopi 4042]
MASYFELTELHIHPRAQGRGLGEALAGDCSPGAAKPTCCCRHRKPTARPTGRGGCTGGWASPTSSADTTSPAIRDPLRSLGGHCRFDPERAATSTVPVRPCRHPSSGTMTWCAPAAIGFFPDSSATLDASGCWHWRCWRW